MLMWNSSFFLSLQGMSLSLVPVAPTLEHRASVKRFHFSLLIVRQSVGFLARGIAPSQGRYLQKHRINAFRYPCLEWHSKPRSHSSSERKQFMPQTARPLWSDSKVWIALNSLFGNLQDLAVRHNGIIALHLLLPADIQRPFRSTGESNLRLFAGHRRLYRRFPLLEL
jgi:hypothetical protein